MENTEVVNGQTAGQTAQPSYADLLAQIERLKAEKAAGKHTKLSFKVGEKGGVSVYGLGRFPVSLYRTQWERLNAAMPEVMAFIEANANLLKVKE